MNKFQKTVAADSGSTLNKRAKLLVSSVENKMAQKIFDIKNRKNEIEMQIEQLTDVAPENTYDLRPGGKNFDPDRWVTEVIALKTELYTLNIELEIAEDVQSEWFAEEDIVEESK